MKKIKQYFLICDIRILLYSAVLYMHILYDHLAP